jgi:membrane fusion protein, multidrug efflux system
MKKISISLLFAISIMAFSCNSDKTLTNQGEEQPRIEPVRVMRLDYQSIARNIEHSSNLLAFEEIHLAPASPGRVEDIYVEIGSRVSKGQVLVQMDRTQLHQAEVQLRLLEADFKRLDTLQKVGSIPQQQYDQLKAQVEITRTNVEFLKQNTRMLAPFSGVVAGKYFEPGEMFTGAPNTQVGKAAVLTLVQTNKLKAMVQVSERFVPFIKQGMEVSLRADVYPGEVFVGVVSRIHPTVNPLTRTFMVELVVPNANEKLRPGMFTRASIDIKEV